MKKCKGVSAVQYKGILIQPLYLHISQINKILKKEDSLFVHKYAQNLQFFVSFLHSSSV